MKNTKHTENLDNSTPQEITSQSKRKILTSIGVSSGIIGASALSQQWTKPIVNSIILPAHAQSTPMMTTMAPGMMTTMAPGMMTTMAPAPASRIMVVAGQATMTVGDGSQNTLQYHVSLTDQPNRNVTIMVELDPSDGDGGSITGGSDLTFTRGNYMDEQTVTITAPDAIPDDPEVTVNFMASGSDDYMDEKTSVMYTVVEDDPVAPMMVSAKATVTSSGGGENGVVEVKWEAPKTTKKVLYYLVHQSNSEISGTPAADDSDTNADENATSAMVTGLAGGSYYFAVTAAFGPRSVGGNFQTASAGPTPTVIS